MWFFVGGSEFRAHWNDWIKDSQEKFYRDVSKCRFCQKCQLNISNTLKAIFCLVKYNFYTQVRNFLEYSKEFT
jgi:hypothetical protein